MFAENLHKERIFSETDWRIGFVRWNDCDYLVIFYFCNIFYSDSKKNQLKIKNKWVITIFNNICAYVSSLPDPIFIKVITLNLSFLVFVKRKFSRLLLFVFNSLYPFIRIFESDKRFIFMFIEFQLSFSRIFSICF